MVKTIEQITDEAMTQAARELSPGLVDSIKSFINHGLTRKEILNILMSAGSQKTAFQAAMLESLVEELYLETECSIPC